MFSAFSAVKWSPLQFLGLYKCGDQETCDGKFAAALTHHQCNSSLDCNSCKQRPLPPIRSAVLEPVTVHFCINQRAAVTINNLFVVTELWQLNELRICCNCL